MWLSGVVSIFIFFWTIICARKDETSFLLSRLLSPRSLAQETPVIIIVDPENQLKLLENDKIPDSASVDSGAVRDDETAGDEDVYLLYNALRSHPRDHLNPSEIKQLEETKQVLREALRARCSQLNKCIKKCPRKRRNKCKSKCIVKIDKKNVCDETEDYHTSTTVQVDECEEEKCEPKQKWGKTMPPDWLLRFQSK